MREAVRDEGGEVRQPPWFTFALIALLVCSFAYLRAERGQADAQLSAALGEAEEYFRAHPYLTLPELLGAQLGAQAEPLRTRYLDDQRSRGAVGVPAGIQRREQQRLDDLVQEAAGRASDHPTQRWGMPASAHTPLALVSHLLLHASWLHLLGSLFALLLLGFYLEGGWGASLFGLVALGSTVAAAGAYGALADPGAGVWIGSSGLLAGLLGAFAVCFGKGWRDPARALVFATGTLFLAAPLMMGVEWAVAEGSGLGARSSALVLAFAFGIGAAAAAGVRASQLDRILGRRPRSDRSVAAGQLLLERALEQRAAGRLDPAFRLLTNRLREDPDDRDAALALWDVAHDLGRPAAAAAALLGVIRDEVKRGDTAQAVQHWLELAEIGLERDAEPALAVRMATLLAASDRRTAATQALQHALARAGAASGPALATRIARAAASIDPVTAVEAAWRALGFVELTLDERQSLEGLLAETLPRSTEAALRSPGARRPAVSAPPAAAKTASAPSLDLEAPLDPEAALLEPFEPDPFPDPAAASRPERERAAPAAEARKPEAIEIETAARTLQTIPAVPTGFDADGLNIVAAGGVKKRVRYDRIVALSVVAVGGLGPKPVIILDLILNWMSLADEPLRIIRLRGDRFDPRKLVAEHAAPVDALRALVEKLLRASKATPLPDLQSAKGLPFAGFDDLETYHRDVLMVDVESAEPYAWTQD